MTYLTRPRLRLAVGVCSKNSAESPMDLFLVLTATNPKKGIACQDPYRV